MQFMKTFATLRQVMIYCIRQSSYFKCLQDGGHIVDTKVKREL